jgi:glycosyltransferase involved in cell wall biosynthesis
MAIQYNAKVAIITRTKNRPITLRRAIASVAAQTCGDYIQVIVNDGGDPGTVEDLVSSSGNSERIIVLHNDVSLGMEAASNLGIRSCESKYILIHDDDDSLHPEFLEKTTSFLEQNGSLFCGVSSWITLVLETLGEHEIKVVSESLYSSLLSVSIGQMAACNRLVPIAFLYKRDLHDQIGYYDEQLPVLGDWDFFLRALEKFDIGIVPKALAFYHQRILEDGIYASSLMAAHSKHAIYTQLLKNRMFRREVESGIQGIGFISQMSSMMQSTPITAFDYIKCIAFQIYANKPERVAIYGTGNIGVQLFHEIASHGTNIGCFIENKTILEQNARRFMDVPIYSLDEAIAKGYLDIAIGSWEYKNVVIDRIHSEVDVAKLRVRLYSA